VSVTKLVGFEKEQAPSKMEVTKPPSKRSLPCLWSRYTYQKSSTAKKRGPSAARILYARGYDLHLVGRSEEKLSAIATECGANFTVGDVNEGSLFSRAAKDAEESLDGLVYAVGTINLRSLQRLTETDF